TSGGTSHVGARVRAALRRAEQQARTQRGPVALRLPLSQARPGGGTLRRLGRNTLPVEVRHSPPADPHEGKVTVLPSCRLPPRTRPVSHRPPRPARPRPVRHLLPPRLAARLLARAAPGPRTWVGVLAVSLGRPGQPLGTLWRALHPSRRAPLGARGRPP